MYDILRMTYEKTAAGCQLKRMTRMNQLQEKGNYKKKQ